ncbi:MAG: hypothetical protein WBN07_00735 [Woeseiaceae bacterium]
MNQAAERKGSYRIVFSGHRIDAPGRTTPRFPASGEPVAARLIANALRTEVAANDTARLEGIASGANGGDILFLEACAAQGVPATIYLALPKDEFVAASVADGGEDWVRRFERLCETMPVHVLEHDENSPLNVYQQTNLWMLERALAHNSAGVTVMVLWDGASGDGAGGTRDMVQRASEAGARVIRLDTSKLQE